MAATTSESLAMNYARRERFSKSESRRSKVRDADFSVEAWLDLDLPFEVELLRVALAALVPLLQDLSEAHCIDLDELLERGRASAQAAPSGLKKGGMNLKLPEVALEDTPALTESFPLELVGSRRAIGGREVPHAWARGPENTLPIREKGEEAQAKVSLLLEVEGVDLKTDGNQLGGQMIGETGVWDEPFPSRARA